MQAGFGGAGTDPRKPGGLRERLDGLRKRLGATPPRPQVNPQGMDQGMAAFRNWRQQQGPQIPQSGIPGGNMPDPTQQPIPDGDNGYEAWKAGGRQGPNPSLGQAGGNMPDPNLQAAQSQFRQPIPRGGYTGRGLTTNAASSPLGRGVGSIGGGYDF